MVWLVPIIISFVATVLFMIAFRPLTIAVGLVDRPGGRKSHSGVVPIVGGLAMFLAIGLVVSMSTASLSEIILLPIACGLLVLIGVVDDRFELPPATRFLAQVLAVLIMVYGGGLIMRDIGDPLWIGVISLGSFALFLTILMALTVINAINMIDGVDGLAGSIVFIALLGIATVSGSGAVFGFALISAASAFGYLSFNLPLRVNSKMRSFMGDAGSTMLGLIVVWLTISICQGSDRLISPVVGLWFVALPIFDLFTCFVRRCVRRRSPLIGGHDHIHHTLRRSGMSDREILVVLVAISFMYASIGVIGHFMMVSESMLFTLWSITGVSQHIVVKRICTLRRARRGRIASTV